MLHSGWVEKRSSGGLGIPKRRFLALLNDRLVTFRQQPPSLDQPHLLQPNAVIPLAAIAEVRLADGPAQQSASFLLVTDSNTFSMKCESHDDANVWVKAVSR